MRIDRNYVRYLKNKPGYSGLIFFKKSSYSFSGNSYIWAALINSEINACLICGVVMMLSFNILPLLN